MKICVGLKDSRRIAEYIKAGADEFYCGVVDQVWKEKFGYFIGLNRRPWPTANMSSFEELGKVVRIAHSYGKEVFFTINEHCYTNEQLPLIDYYVYNALQQGVDAIIFADPGLIQYFYNKYQCTIHLSTGGSVFNQWTAKFFRDGLKVTRLILPREITLQEIGDISQNVKDVEYEVFILNEGCLNIDGFCNHSHGVQYVDSVGYSKSGEYSAGCMLKYDILGGTIKGQPIDEKDDISSKLYDAASRCGSCGVCAIHYFKRIGVTSLKLVGRSTEKDKIIADIAFIKKAISLAEQIDDITEYSDAMRELNGYERDNMCQRKCYYPELLGETTGKSY